MIRELQTTKLDMVQLNEDYTKIGRVGCMGRHHRDALAYVVAWLFCVISSAKAKL